MLKDILLEEKESRKKQNMSKKNEKGGKGEKSKKEEVKQSKRNRPRIFSRDFNKLPVSCSPSS